MCAAPTGAANLGLYGKMASVSYEDYPDAKMIIVWGVNPGVSGIHLMPFLKEARDNGAFIVVIDPRATGVARQADLHLAVRPGTDLPVALAIHRYLFEEGHANQAFLDAHTNGAAQLREKAREWTFERAAEVSGVSADQLRQLAERYAKTSPALVKCGWGLERNRNGGSAAAAVLALPAVAGKFGVRGGGYSMSNSASWNIERTWLTDAEPPTRAVNMNKVGRILTEPEGAPVNVLFVYNCNPVAILPDQRRVIRGLEREDLFTVVFDQVLTDTAMYADVVLPATTFLEHYDFAQGLRPDHAAARQAGDRCGRRIAIEHRRVHGSGAPARSHGRRRSRRRSRSDADGARRSCRAQIGDDLREQLDGEAPPHGGRPVQFVDVFPKTADQKVDLFPAVLDKQAPMGLYGFQPDPATGGISAGADFAGERSHDQLHARRAAAPRREARDESGRRRRRAASRTAIAIRVWNALGEVRIKAHCHATGQAGASWRCRKACGAGTPPTATRRTR